MDWWVGLGTRLFPAQRRGSLVLFDRDFSDLAVDQRRYLVQGVGALARWMRPLVPRSDVSYVLDADPEVVHHRKPELPVAELDRQRREYRRLCSGDRRMRLVYANRPLDAVLGEVACDLTMLLARRERLRARPALSRTRDAAVATAAIVVLSPVMAGVAASCPDSSRLTRVVPPGPAWAVR